MPVLDHRTGIATVSIDLYERLARDAERYRFLRGIAYHADPEEVPYCVLQDARGIVRPITGYELDAKIDKAGRFPPHQTRTEPE